ncbi:MAG: trypsin-like peptidase domain-containing protein [Caldilineaceae bacterium]|nr:trypsin-like peptidase domain-containing protein [Caldilineaceae bacterium]
MIDDNYQLVSLASRRGTQRRRTLAERAVGIGALAIVLVVGVLYGPLLWEQSAVAAKPASIGSAAPVQQEVASLTADQEALANLYSQASPSVVNIQVTSRIARFPGFGLPDEDGEAPLEQALGSGFIYDDQGHIVTNNHVVSGAEDVLVLFSNGYWANAEVVAADPQADIAVIKVTPPEGMAWRPLPLAEVDELRVGHTVIAIGNPFGLDGTMTTGIVSAMGRGIPLSDGETTANYTLPDVIQTDAAINPGNSGGPLLDLNGNVVGVNFAIRSQVRSNTGVGFAIPVSILRRVIPALIADGRYSYAYLGLYGSSITPFLAEALELPANHLGVYVTDIVAGGPSEAAGLQGGSETITVENGFELERGGDIIIAVDGNTVMRFEDLISFLVTKASPGQVITLTVLRGDETLDVPVTLGERPSGRASASAARPDEDGINARKAIELATDAAEEEELITGEVTERIATPEVLEGVDVWVVELVTENETVTVTIDTLTGEVLDIGVE